MWGKLAIISSRYGVLHLFNGVDDEDLAHAVYRVVVEDLYDNAEARSAENFGNGCVGHEVEVLDEEFQSGWDSEGESSS